jgi:2-oxoglutarate ferredoxin oxidoreductase subunit beta
MEHREGFPTPIGVLRAWDEVPRYEDVVHAQLNDVLAKRGPGNLEKLLRAGDTWRVEAR